MAFLTYPLDDVNYNASGPGLYFSGRTSGVFSADEELQVTSNNNMTVTVKPGRAWLTLSKFQGAVFLNDAPTTIFIPQANGVMDRIDRVVVQYEKGNNTANIILKQGAVSANPRPTALVRDDNTFEIGLADIRVRKGVLLISASNIKDTRLDEDLCGLVSDGVSKISTSGLNDQFQDWFNSLKVQLDTNQATNLQNQITNLTKRVDDIDDVYIIFKYVYGRGTKQEQIVTRYNNGVQTIEMKITYLTDIKEPWGAMYSTPDIRTPDHAFRQPFIRVPAITGMAGSGGAYAFVPYKTNAIPMTENNLGSVILTRPISSPTVELTMGVQLTGFWK